MCDVRAPSRAVTRCQPWAATNPTLVVHPLHRVESGQQCWISPAQKLEEKLERGRA